MKHVMNFEDMLKHRIFAPYTYFRCQVSVHAGLNYTALCIKIERTTYRHELIIDITKSYIRDSTSHPLEASLSDTCLSPINRLPIVIVKDCDIYIPAGKPYSIQKIDLDISGPHIFIRDILEKDIAAHRRNIATMLTQQSHIFLVWRICPSIDLTELCM